MGTCLLKGSVNHPWMVAFLKRLVRWAIREDIPEPQPVASQLPPREAVKEARDDQSSDDDLYWRVCYRELSGSTMF